MIDYVRSGQVAVSLEYDSGRIVAAHAGPGLEANDLVEIQRVLEETVLADFGTTVRRHVAFATLPVTASWCYEDRFQILPAPEHAPRPPAFLGDHPFILEVVHAASSDWMITLNRAQIAVTDVNLVLAGVVPYIRSDRWGRRRSLWSVPVGASTSEPDEQPVHSGSAWIQEAYILDGYNAVADQLTQYDGDEVELVADAAYYTRPGIPGNAVLDFPASVHEMFRRYYALDPSRRDRLLRWAYWLNHSRHVGVFSSSARYIAIVQAVEALRPNVPGGSPCSTCGQSARVRPIRPRPPKR